MSDIILEISRAIVVIIIFTFLLLKGRKSKLHKQTGWSLIIFGFGFILFGMLIDITDNFEQLNKYIVVGDTEYQAFLEKVIGYLVGFFILAIGFWKWIPIVVKLEETEQKLEETINKLEESKNNTEKKIIIRTSELEKLNKLMVNRELEMVELKNKIKKLGG